MTHQRCIFDIVLQEVQFLWILLGLGNKLQALGSITRPNFLETVPHLAPLILHFGGVVALREVHHIRSGSLPIVKFVTFGRGERPFAPTGIMVI